MRGVTATGDHLRKKKKAARDHFQQNTWSNLDPTVFYVLVNCFDNLSENTIQKWASEGLRNFAALPPTNIGIR